MRKKDTLLMKNILWVGKKNAILLWEGKLELGRDDREFIIIIIINIIASRFKSFLEMGCCGFVGRGSMKYSYERSIVS